MRQIFGCVAIFSFVVLAWAAKPATPAKKTPAKTSAVRKGTGKRTPARTASSRTGQKGVAAKRPATTWRNRQLAPTPDRYRQIQEALAAKGYLRSEDATGTWNQASVEALKRFQAEQKLESTGKINSLSLIALGLGPKHDATMKPPPPSPVQEQIPGR
jgi:peptidoglycan hydrolase-like protein with peptidoglycan-binding domain